MGILLVIEDRYSNSGSAPSDYIFPSPPNGPDDGKFIEFWLTIFYNAACCSDVFRRSAKSWCPHLLAKVTGVSPSAFFIVVLAPHIIRNLAISSFGDCPHTRCNALSPFWFYKSRSTWFWFKKYMSSLLLVLAAMCNSELFQFYLSLKSATLAPWVIIFFNSSNFPSSASYFIESSLPFISSTCSYISLVAIGSKQ